MVPIRRGIFGLTLLVLVVAAVAEDKLIMIQTLIRHGARTLYYENKNELADQKERAEKLALLTPQGKHMSYVLGKLLYQKYWKLLFRGTPYQHRFYSSLLEVWSTPTERTISSAEGLLLGLLEDLQPQTLQKKYHNLSLPPFFDPSLKAQRRADKFAVFGLKGRYYHSIPIHSEPVLEETSFEEVFRNRITKTGNHFLMISDQNNCLTQQRWIRQNIQTEQFQRILNSTKVKQFFSEVSKEVGYSVTDQKQINKIIDGYYVNKNIGRPTLKLLDNPQNIKTAEFLLFSINLLLFHNIRQKQTVFTPFLQMINASIHKTIKQDKPKIYLYSGHETTLLNFLAAFEMTSLKCLTDDFFQNNQSDLCTTEYPHFSSSIIVELWQYEQSSLHYLKVQPANTQILYNGVERKIPVCGNKVKCPLSEFSAWAEKFYQEDPWTACGLPKISLI